MSNRERVRLMADGRAAFNRGDFFLAHEQWEEVWRSCVGPDRKWLRALIQVAAGMHHLAAGRPASAEGLLARALHKLGDAPDQLDGIDLAAARRDADRLLAELRRGDRVDPRSMILVDG